MVTTYKKVGVDIMGIKKSQGAIGQIISSTHNLQKLAKVAHGFGHYAGIVQIPGEQIFGYTYRWSRYKDSNCKHAEKI